MAVICIPSVAMISVLLLTLMQGIKNVQNGSQLAITIVLPMGKSYGRQIVYTYFRTAVAFLTSKSEIQCRFTIEMECTLF